MATRIQGLLFGIGTDAQANIATASSSYIRMKKLNMDVSTSALKTENDKAEIGKGSEWVEETFLVAKDVNVALEKYCSAEIALIVSAFGLGDVSEDSGTYTIKPIDPGCTLELPYFSLVEQLAEGDCGTSAHSAINHKYTGCAVNNFAIAFNSSPGRQSAKLTANIVGSGRIATPSAVTLPAIAPEHGLLGQSLSLVVHSGTDTIDYVTASTILNGSFVWNNNLMVDAGYTPGSGTEDGFAIRSRLEIGVRDCYLEYTVRLLKTSIEYAKLISQTTGSATLGLTYDSSHSISIKLEKVSFDTVTTSEENGIATVRVRLLPHMGDNGVPVTITAKCSELTGVAQ